MVDGEVRCTQCGAALTGRDRYEGTCSACREEAVLGAAPPPETEGAGVTAACRRRVAVRCSVLGLVGVLLLAIGWWVLRTPRRAESPTTPPAAAVPERPSAKAAASAMEPEPAAGPVTDELPARLRQETEALLVLLQGKKYSRILDDYCQPDEEEFERVQAVVEHLVRGRGAEGLRGWTQLVERVGLADAAARLRRAGDPHPGYTLGLLTHLARNPAASGEHEDAVRRARSVLAWYIAGVFEGLDVARAQVTPKATQTGREIVVSLACGGRASTERPGDDPRRLRWQALPAGWVLRFAAAERLEAVRDILSRTEAASDF